MIRWGTLPFAELTAPQLYEILQLREEVFILEQHCFYQDLDGYDIKAAHIMGWEDNTLTVYARILPPASKYLQTSIGRVAVRQSHRGRGFARELFQRALDETLRLYPGQPVLVQSQCYLEEFYGSFGFVAVSAPYDEDGIMHVDMIREA